MQPNILLITTDEQHCRTLGIYGNPVVRTPHLDALGRDGVIFDRAYCANPLCSPSRSSILTGQYPANHGCWTVGVKLPKTTPSVAQILAQNDYNTAALGKMHFQPCDPGPGKTSEEAGQYERNEHDFDTWHGPYYGFQEAQLATGHTVNPVSHGLHYGKWLRRNNVDIKKYFDDVASAVRQESKWEDTLWNLPLEYHNSVWTADITIDFLKRQAKSDRPFFAWTSFQDPHDPYRVPNPYHDRYRPEDVLPLVKKEGEMEDKPPHYKQFFYGTDPSWLFDMEDDYKSVPGGYEYWTAAKDFPEYRHRLWNACVYGMVNLIDDQVGRILAALAELGMAENTLVVFTSDHGDCMGNHYFWFKGPFHYEDIVRVPLIARWPAGIRKTGRTSALISLIDLAPTFLNAAGIEVSKTTDGRSILPVFSNAAESIRDICVVENRCTRTTLYALTVINEQYKATFYEGKQYGELFDLKNDPNEFVNLWEKREYDQRRFQLAAALISERMRSEHNLPPRICYA